MRGSEERDARVYGGYRDAMIMSIQVGTLADARSCENVSNVLGEESAIG